VSTLIFGCRSDMLFWSSLVLMHLECYCPLKKVSLIYGDFCNYQIIPETTFNYNIMPCITKNDTRLLARLVLR